MRNQPKKCLQQNPSGHKIFKRYCWHYWRGVNNLSLIPHKLRATSLWEEGRPYFCDRTCGIVDRVSDTSSFSRYWFGFNPTHPSVTQLRLIHRCCCLRVVSLAIGLMPLTKMLLAISKEEVTTNEIKFYVKENLFILTFLNDIHWHMKDTQMFL